MQFIVLYSLIGKKDLISKKVYLSFFTKNLSMFIAICQIFGYNKKE